MSFKVGDKVKFINEDIEGEIIAIESALILHIQMKERRGSPTTLGCSTNSKNPKHPVSKHRTYT